MSVPRKSSRGTLLILGMVLLALLAAVAVFFCRRYETRQALALWGPEAAATIVGPDRVELLQLAPADGPDSDLSGGADRLRIVNRRDVTDAAGFTNAREALTLDRSFRWQETDGCRPRWTHALQFTRGERTATVLLSFDCGGQAMLAGGRRRVGLGPISTVIEKLFRGESPEAGPPRGAASGEKVP